MKNEQNDVFIKRLTKTRPGDMENMFLQRQIISSPKMSLSFSINLRTRTTFIHRVNYDLHTSFDSQFNPPLSCLLTRVFFCSCKLCMNNIQAVDYFFATKILPVVADCRFLFYKGFNKITSSHCCY